MGSINSRSQKVADAGAERAVANAATTAAAVAATTGQSGLDSGDQAKANLKTDKAHKGI